MSDYEPTCVPARPNGMKGEQKDRIGKYMDDFRRKNGGCLLCVPDDDKVKPSPIAEYSAYPDVDAVKARLFLYGLCYAHAHKKDSDRSAEEFLMKRAETNTAVEPGAAQTVLIDLSQPVETRTFL